ncbi:MAG TPA: hypothetical protein VF440_10045 [Novosphingobium sp.]
MIDDPHFTLDLGPPWLPLPRQDAEHYRFRDAARDIVMTLSALALDSRAEDLAFLADKLVRTRLQAEVDAAAVAGRRFTAYEPIVAPQSWGQAVAYYGHDDAHDDGPRQFGYAGLVTPRSLISLYMSSGRLSEYELAEAMDDMLARIGFDRSPLAPCS